jgi:hypothetical protein
MELMQMMPMGGSGSSQMMSGSNSNGKSGGDNMFNSQLMSNISFNLFTKSSFCIGFRINLFSLNISSYAP